MTIRGFERVMDEGSRGGVESASNVAPRAVYARLEGILAPAGLAALALPPLGGGTPSEDRPAAVLVDRDLSPAAKRRAFGLAAERLRATGGGWARLSEIADG